VAHSAWRSGSKKRQEKFTLYPVIGDLFAWLAVVGFVIMAGWAILRRHG